jgi:hypothetical protein
MDASIETVKIPIQSGFSQNHRTNRKLNLADYSNMAFDIVMRWRTTKRSDSTLRKIYLFLSAKK